MKKLRLTRLLAVILALIMVLPLFAACKKKTYDNEKDQLVVGLEEPDGVFNSFFATSGNDTTVAGTVAASMIKSFADPNIPAWRWTSCRKLLTTPTIPIRLLFRTA